jgi:hypothetical protein
MAGETTPISRGAGSSSRTLVFALGLLVLSMALAGFFWYEATKGWTCAKLKRIISAELPPGSTRAQVEDWLDAHGFPIQISTPDKTGPWSATEVGLDPREVGVEILLPTARP